MNKQTFDINKIRVASPCSVGWETMTGDERVRLCHSCNLNIYNIAEMTKADIENLLAKCEDRICIRLYKRSDGTVLTRDCPVGFRAYQKRVARFAGAALATIFGLFSVSFGQKENKKTIDASKEEIVRIFSQTEESILSGVVNDPAGAVIPGVELKLYKKGEKNFLKAVSDDEGNYTFKSIKAGTYILEGQAQGFKKYKLINLEIKNNESISINLMLQAKNTNVTVGIFVSEPLIDSTSSSITTKITRKQIENLPF